MGQKKSPVRVSSVRFWRKNSEPEKWFPVNRSKQLKSEKLLVFWLALKKNTKERLPLCVSLRDAERGREREEREEREERRRGREEESVERVWKVWRGERVREGREERECVREGERKRKRARKSERGERGERVRWKK